MKIAFIYGNESGNVGLSVKTTCNLSFNDSLSDDITFVTVQASLHLKFIECQKHVFLALRGLKLC